MVPMAFDELALSHEHGCIPREHSRLSMQVRAPFAYSVEYFVKNGRNRARRTLIDHVQRDVPEIGIEEAPIALRWRHSGRTMSVSRPSVVRLHDGNFYQSAAQMWVNQGLDDVPGAGDIVMNPHQNKKAAAIYSGETDGLAFRAVFNFLSGRKPQERPADDEVEFDLGDDLTERRLEAEERLNQILLIDNEIWIRIHEPILAVITDPPSAVEPQIRKFVFTGIPRLNTLGVPPDAIAFRIGQSNGWPQHGEPVDQEKLRICADDIHVDIPDAFCFDQVRNDMLRATEAFVQLLGPEIHTWRDDTISSYIGIRNALREHLSNQFVPIEDIIEKIPPLLASIERRTVALRTVWRACEHALSKEPSIDIFLNNRT
jgi:hypothetical protein